MPPRADCSSRATWLVVTVGAVLSALPIAEARADQRRNLALPLIGALALGRSALAAAALGPAPPPAQRPGLIPSRLQIPDGYQLDLQRDPPRFADPVDTDTVVGMELFRQPSRNLSMSLSYDEEDRPVGSGSDCVRFTIEVKW